MSLADRVAQLRTLQGEPNQPLSGDYSAQLLIDRFRYSFLLDPTKRSPLPNPETSTFTNISPQTLLEERQQLLRSAGAESALTEIRNDYWGRGRLSQHSHGYSLEFAYNIRGRRTDHPTREFAGYEEVWITDNTTYGVGAHKRTLHYKEIVPVSRITGWTTSYEEREVRHTLLVGALSAEEIQNFEGSMPSLKKDEWKDSVQPADLHLVLFIDPFSFRHADDKSTDLRKLSNGLYPMGGGSIVGGSGPLWLNETSRQIFSPSQERTKLIDALAKYVIDNDFDRIPLCGQIKNSAKSSSAFLKY